MTNCAELKDTSLGKLKQKVYNDIKERGSYSRRALIHLWCDCGAASAKDVRQAIRELLDEGKIVKGDYTDYLGKKTDDLICVEQGE